MVVTGMVALGMVVLGLVVLGLVQVPLGWVTPRRNRKEGRPPPLFAYLADFPDSYWRVFVNTVEAFASE